MTNLLLPIAAFCLGISLVEAADPVDLPTYGRYGSARRLGANWLYRYSQSGLNSAIYDKSFDEFRISILANPFRTEMFTGRSKRVSYTRNGLQTMEETGFIKNGDFDRGRNTYFRRVYEYWDTKNGCTYLGSDIARSRKWEPILRDRIDRGMVIPARMRVGQVVSSSGDFYEKGRFLGRISYRITLMDRKPVKVIAGNFDKCVHLRTVITEDQALQIADEWWAKEVGMVKRVGGEGDFSYSELVAYNLNGDRLVVPGKLAISGTDAIPELWWPGSFDIKFDPVPVGGMSAEKSVTISNDGDAPLEFSAKVTGSEHFTFSDIPKKVTLKCGESLVVKAHFHPRFPLMYSAGAQVVLTYQEDHAAKEQRLFFIGSDAEPESPAK